MNNEDKGNRIVGNLASSIKCIHKGVALKEGEPLSSHTSMKVGGKADCYIVPHDEQMLIDVIGV
ncbi:MAG: hypothetical protein LBH63_01460, partial [Clostridiales Family XIII bacterium]|nr:hypothetical protein [Clostridiales Family XIII bacterium]